MQNFFFHNPTKIIFGKNTIAQIGHETSHYGKKALLVYGQGSIKKNGIYENVTTSLKDYGVEIFEHGNVQSNPLVRHIREGISVAKQEGIDVIVAVGGGSVIDSAKAIGAGAVADHDVWKFFNGKKGIRKTLPVACVLTLAAAGSEMNGGMVITNEEKNQKIGIGNKRLHPKISILDPTTTYSVPSNYTAYGAADAIAHILEFYFTTEDPSTPVQDRLMEGLVINIMESCETVLAAPEDYQGRADIMWCSTLALNGLTAAGLGKVQFPMHMIEHSLSGLYNVPHGAGLSVVMPGWMCYQTEINPSKLAQFAERVLNIKGDNPKDSAIKGITILKDWFSKISCPTSLKDLNISEADIPDIAENALEQAKIWRLREYTSEKIETILKLCA